MSAVVVPIPTTATLAVRPWPDPVIDALGHDPRSAYVEQYWLPILRPPSTSSVPVAIRSVVCLPPTVAAGPPS